MPKASVCPQDYLAAADWFHRAAGEGSAHALYHLGTLQHYGFGLARDPAAAIDWYRIAAERGGAAATLRLGVLHATGEDVPQDYAGRGRMVCQGGGARQP